jgi:hypothetical protein
MQIGVVMKNAYFTHFAVQQDDGTVVSKVHRSSEQIWNAQGIAMQVQGTMPNGSAHWGKGTFNCFAKKHLLATGGGKSDANTKMANIVGRRDVSGAATAHKNRGLELEALKKAMITGVADKEKGQKLKQAARDLRQHYEQFAYGATRTPICTFVLLDGMTANDIKDIFATPLVNAETSGWNEDEKKSFVITFPTNCVATYDMTNTRTDKNTISVDVVKNSGGGATMYYIYHCNG